MTHLSPNYVVAAVDDDPSVLRSLEYLLQSADYDVRLFTSAAALLENCCLSEVDCLISDIDMPHMDGFELLRLVRAACPQLPAILITGHLDTLQRVRSPAASDATLFTKPFQGSDLLVAVAEAIRAFRK
jgi:FixJ family two-component response regulator